MIGLAIGAICFAVSQIILVVRVRRLEQRVDELREEEEHER